jgi:lysophospholipase L1-like esterase
MKNFPLLIILCFSVLAVTLFGINLPSASRASIVPDTYLSGLLINLNSGTLFTPRILDSSTVQPPSPSSAVKTEVPQKTTEVTTSPDAAKTPPLQTSEPSMSPSSPEKVTALVAQNFTTVDKSYFNDALFIGDSRMVGMQEYSGLKNATYYALTGLTLFYLFDNAFISDGGAKQIRLEEALMKKQFGKIYLMVGINELGTGSQQYFNDTYREAILRIQKLQPNAIIFIQGVLYVTGSRSETDKYINNKNIRERNRNIAELADGIRVFYIDVNEVTSDSSGNLNVEYSWDSCHLQAKYYGLWTEFLMKHGVVPSAAPSPSAKPSPMPTHSPSPVKKP